MQPALENFSKQQLIARFQAEQQTARTYQVRLAEVDQSTERKFQQNDQIIAQLTRMLFGQKHERFEGHPDQGSLPFEASPEQPAPHRSATRRRSLIRTINS